MAAFDDQLMAEVRSRFAQVDYCQVQGERIFFENAGGALTLKSVVATSQAYAAMPDNQGRANAGSAALAETIAMAKANMAVMMNAPAGQFFVGESGTELLFRLITTACVAQRGGGRVLGSTLEHPATRSACARWAGIADLTHQLVTHDDATGSVNVADYAAAVTPDTVVATIVHTSPVTGIGVEVAAIAAAIRAVAPDCYIIVDGIQHAAHGQIDIASYDVDGYVISPYKMFSRHGFGLAWISDRMTELPHDNLLDGPADNWEMGTRDSGAYATLSDVFAYLDWLGGEVSAETDARRRIVAAGGAISAHEAALTDAMINGSGNLRGLAQMPGVEIIAGAENPHREGLVCFHAAAMDAGAIVAALNAQGIRTHIRKNDHYSSNILQPLGLDACVRVSLCHYNSPGEVAQFLAVVGDLLDPPTA